HVGENEVKLSLGHLSKGVYTLRVSTAQGVVSQKVILE
ncbi:T9SS type A sorting domain-containing protein, partial [bacterium]|nr:T9SS type A sorting domain-containing protein [bacterium]MBI1316740.1 T9SS type A sorting domain-containing protein [bacterium]